MDTQDIDFASLLKQHTDQAAMKADRLMTLIQQRFPAIPEWKNQTEKERCVRAIENWLYRSIRKPRAEQWPLVVAIAAVLSLKGDEVEQLLQVAGMKMFGSLQQGAPETYQELFGVWMKPVFAEEVQRSLTEIGKDLEEQGGLIKDIHTHVLSVKWEPLEEEKPIWMVPFARNPYFTGREEMLDRLAQQLTSKQEEQETTTRRAALTQPQAIRGLGGIGKTQVAVEYAYRSRDLGRYWHTFWMNAVSEETIIASFVEMAERLPPPFTHDGTDQRKLVEAVKRWLEQCQQPWLLICDNADDVALVRNYLPKLGLGSIVWTTRAHAVGSLATPVEVETMGFVEGTQLLLRRAQRFEDASDDEINQAGNIVVALDHFPLALDQAGAYIEETQCRLADYLDLYRTHRQILLARRGEQATKYPDSVATTWSLSFHKVEEANPAAAELLRLCAFLAPDRIPEELIIDGADQWNSPLQEAAANRFTFNRMIADLLKFSLVRRLVETQAFSIHRLVQAVQRDAMELEVQHQWAERVVRAVSKVFPHDIDDVAAWPLCLRYLDQAQACNAMIERYMLTFSEGANLLNRTGLYLCEHALYTIAEPLHQRAYLICEQQLGTEHLSTVACLNNLALLYQAQGRYELAEPLLQQALSHYEQQMGATHLKTATSLNNLAALYWHQGKYKEAEPLLKRALMIREQQLGPFHPDTATCLNSLAFSMMSRRNMRKRNRYISVLW